MRRLEIGQKATLSRKVNDEDVRAFAELSGDRNPIHLDEEAAARSRFGRRVAHGMFSAVLISAVLGTRLPGPGTVYLSQTMKFEAPVYLGDEILAEVEVVDMRDDRPVLTLRTTCSNQDGVVVLSGEAVVLFEQT